ncbi:adenosylmethionine-8-amino-7-oxononanoate aminotransferase [Aspergillus homomorphus CBS 101889]|uniref:Bifunctional dethiobiotin synthetase/adenosylmethionine-8-amino-7-oxononanoate aminotransferase n=1 Tax=Aspergillus homomorphus (strain CBS 101889) TaxID=1450537 RepID=A0A395HKB2_ASPHC|nr:bifunctional dethiobiotin synthetase/adenosylmethionine-8-amino-7-oxononanoate aminotransferase [Aspergillus homomorphus CBS 101889]RAL08372.1 bifunctional dethiobiotin synthetase/adenosylmethionine-8-amino-7-oxononanoate aminotransferase [Aspergillus homomorphus CBS 101889]
MPPAALWRSLRAHQVYGANTDVGKTIVSTLLCNALQGSVGFIKPVSTGPLDEADDRHIQRYAPHTLTKCLFQFDEPVSPHIAAAQKSVPPPSDTALLTAIHETLTTWAQPSPQEQARKHALLETAGGVHSPGPNGTSQADLYRPLRLPVILIADARLGGISASISAYESLVLRGYDVHAVLLFKDDYYQNHAYLRSFFAKKAIPLVAVPAPPARVAAPEEDGEAMSAYYARARREGVLGGVVEQLEEMHVRRWERLDAMAEKAERVIWYPFTQHLGLKAGDITVVDSACGDFFQSRSSRKDGDGDTAGLRATFDGSASWWTQGLGHGNPDLALSAAYAAGRYGHVMFPGNIHEPALALAETLLESQANPRLQRVFYTDNGSTGMEVAVKMGLRAACARYGWDAGRETVRILGLKGSYHGDTIGVMDCSEPSTFNKKVEWYRGRGFWFDFPQVRMKDGVWRVAMPQETALAEEMDELRFGELTDVFDLEARLDSEAGRRYREYIRRTIERLVQEEGVKFGALIMEPVILGAGGMLFCDPLFQRCLADVVRQTPELFAPQTTPAGENDWSGLPIIFDEVFTGLYRLGRRSAASFLQVHPDIAVNAKLLTGGLVPLCTTLASEAIFQAFLSPDKSDALLHGHSYTAHAVGCQVAVDSLRTMMRMEREGSWQGFQRDWAVAAAAPAAAAPAGPLTWSVWSHGLVRDLSQAASVEGVFALGTVLSIALHDQHGTGGYTSTAAQGLQHRLAAGGDQFAVHSRVLGNVLYLMSSVTSKAESLRAIEEVLRGALL